MTIFNHVGDLPDNVSFRESVAVDTETMGLIPGRDRLCLMQLSGGDGDCHLVQFLPDQFDAPRLTTLMSDLSITKLFHFARFDIAAIKRYLGVLCEPVYCTKVASRLVRTYTDRHGLKDLCRELLGVEIAKQQQSSDWGGVNLTPEQLEYAVGDVMHLHRLRKRLDEMLAREGRSELAAACFRFIPVRALLDLKGWSDVDIFTH